MQGTSSIWTAAAGTAVRGVIDDLWNCSWKVCPVESALKNRERTMRWPLAFGYMMLAGAIDD
jgi:hypothetical protein